MQDVMANSTECNQVLLGIIAGLATEFFVMDFKIGHCATRLASPAVATQHLLAESVVQLGIQANACMFQSDSSHDTFSVTWCRNVCLSSPGRNLKNRNADCKRTPGFSFSKFAPARKSAQIISRQ